MDDLKSALTLVDGVMSYDYKNINISVRTDFTHREMFDLIVETLKHDDVKVINDTLVYKNGQLQGSTQAVLSRQAAAVFVQYFVAVGMFLDGDTVQAKFDNLQSIIDRRYWDSMFDADIIEKVGEAKYDDKDFRPSVALPVTPHRKLGTGYKEIVQALRKIKTEVTGPPPEGQHKGGATPITSFTSVKDLNMESSVAVLKAYTDTVRVILSQPVIVKFAALGDAELRAVLTKITADDGWFRAFKENSGNGKVKMVTLLTQVLFVDMNVAWESAIKTRLLDLLSTEDSIKSLMDSTDTDADHSTYASWLSVASYSGPSPRVMYIQRYLAILDAIISNYKDDETHDRMVPVMQKMCAGIRSTIPYLQRTTNFLKRLHESAGLLSRLDGLLNAALSDPARGILTYVKLRYDKVNPGGQWVHNDRFKFLHNEKNHAMRVFYTDTDDAIYKLGDDEKPVRIWPAKPDTFGLTERSHDDPPSFTQDEVEKVQKQADKLYNKQWAIGPFTDVFAPQLDNASIAARLLGEDKSSPISAALMAKNASPVFVIGYGASGAGKTSTLIYYNKVQTNGILIDLCNSIGQDGLDIYMTAVEFFAIPESTEFENSKSLKFVELLDKDGAQVSRVIRRESPVLVFKYQRGSYVLASDTPYTNMHHSRVTTVLDQQSTAYAALPGEQKTEENKPFEMDPVTHVTNFPQNALLGRVVVHMIDTDRYVKATTNNPNSSRSHVLVFLKFGNVKRRQLIIGDFAGVENRFQCDDPKVLTRFDGIRQDMPGNKRGPKFYNVFSTGLSKDELKGGAVAKNTDTYPPFWPLSPNGAWPADWATGYVTPDMLKDDRVAFHDVLLAPAPSAALTPADSPEVGASKLRIIKPALLKFVDNNITFGFIKDSVVTWKGTASDVNQLMSRLGISPEQDGSVLDAIGRVKTAFNEYKCFLKMCASLVPPTYDRTNLNRLQDNVDKYLNEDAPSFAEIKARVQMLEQEELRLHNSKTTVTIDNKTLQAYGWNELYSKYFTGNAVVDELYKKLKNHGTKHVPECATDLKIGVKTLMKPLSQKLINTTSSSGSNEKEYFWGLFVVNVIVPMFWDKDVNTRQARTKKEQLPQAFKTTELQALYNKTTRLSTVLDSIEPFLTDDPSLHTVRQMMQHDDDPGWTKLVEELRKRFHKATSALPGPLNSAHTMFTTVSTWNTSFTGYLQSVAKVPAYAESVFDAVDLQCSDYWSRAPKLADACRLRTLEGDYINHSLRQVRLAITALLLEKNRGRPSVTPPFIDSCLSQYCTDSKGCFADASEDHAPESRAEVQTLMDEIRRKLSTDEKFPNFPMQDVRLALICVVNASRSANEPLHTPYVDATQLKRAFYAGDHDAASTALVALYNDVQARVTNKSPPAKLEYEQLLGELSPFLTFDASSKMPQSAKYHGISAKYVKLLGIIDAWNGPSTIGTLEFTDALSKFARVTTMCTADTITKDLPGNWTDHLAAPPVRKKAASSN